MEKSKAWKHTSTTIKKKPQVLVSFQRIVNIYLRKYMQIPVILEPGIHVFHMQSFKDKLPYLFVCYGTDTDSMRSWIYTIHMKNTVC